MTQWFAKEHRALLNISTVVSPPLPLSETLCNRTKQSVRTLWGLFALTALSRRPCFRPAMVRPKTRKWSAFIFADHVLDPILSLVSYLSYPIARVLSLIPHLSYLISHISYLIPRILYPSSLPLPISISTSYNSLLIDLLNCRLQFLWPPNLRPR